MSPTKPPAPLDTADRRQATIVFADISGFTALSQTMDPEDIRDLMNACFARIEEIVHERGGTIDKWIGDCAMALFGIPLALERAPAYACDAALAIRDAVRDVSLTARLSSPIGVHIGINTGLVIAGEVGGEQRRDYTAMGPTVNLASRLESEAKLGQIFVGDITHRNTATDFAWSEPMMLEVKGIAEPVRAYELKGYAAVGASWRQLGARRLRSGELIGRREELARLQLALDQVKKGRGSALAILGDSGIGKSRLCVDLLEAADERGIRHIVGNAMPVGRSTSFHPFASLLRAWISRTVDRGACDVEDGRRAFVESVIGNADAEIAASIAIMLGYPLQPRAQEDWQLMNPDAQERFVYSALRRLLEAAARREPLMLVLDDMHWADDSSIALLEFLLPAVRESPILFVVLARPDYEETTERFLRMADETLGDAFERLPLSLLSEDETLALLRQILGSEQVPRTVLEIVVDRTAGNPLFIEELVLDMMERGALAITPQGVKASNELRLRTVPQTIEGIVLARVDRLSTQARNVAEICSVIGRECSDPILSAVAGPSSELKPALAELCNAGLLVAGDGERRYEFRHALPQETIYQSLLKKKRRALHLDCARAIEQSYEQTLDEHFSSLAHHYLHAEELEKAEDFLFRAGERAAATAASREALRYFREAYDTYVRLYADRGDQKRRAQLEKQIGLALLNTGRLVESIPHLNNCLRLCGERVPETPVQLHLKLAGDMVSILTRLYLGRSHGRHRSSDTATDRDLFEVLYNRCRAQNPTDPQRAFFDNIAAIRHLGHLDAAQVPHACGIYAAAGAFFAFAAVSDSVCRRFLDVARSLSENGADMDRFQFHAMRYVRSFLAGSWNDDQMPEGLIERALRTGLLWDADTYLGLRAETEIKQGRWEAAERTISSLETLHESYGYSFAQANVMANRAYLLAERGHLDQAWTAANRYIESRDEHTLRVIALSTRAKIEARLDRLDEADRTLVAADAIVASAGRIVPYYSAAHACAHLLVAVMHLEQAAFDNSHQASRHSKDAKKWLARATGLADHVARERVQVFTLAARLAHAEGSMRRRDAWWRKGLVAADALGARPDRERLLAVIVGSLEGTDAAFEGKTADQWKSEM